MSAIRHRNLVVFCQIAPCHPAARRCNRISSMRRVSLRSGADFIAFFSGTKKCLETLNEKKRNWFRFIYSKQNYKWSWGWTWIFSSKWRCKNRNNFYLIFFKHKIYNQYIKLDCLTLIHQACLINRHDREVIYLNLLQNASF